MTDVDEAVAVCFGVKIDERDFGNFISCDGLGCEYVIETREEGGLNGWIWQLPTRIKYTNIKLSRPLTAKTAEIAKWFTDMASGTKSCTATITARTGDNNKVAEWNLKDVIPVRWTGPQLSVENAKAATETLELAHHGFLK